MSSCDRRIPARWKDKVYKIVMRPAIMYGLEMVELAKRQEGGKVEDPTTFIESDHKVYG